MKTSQDYIKELETAVKSDRPSHYRAAKAVQEYIAGSTAIYHGEPIKTLYFPKIFSKEAFQAMKNAAEKTCRILFKITDQYLRDPAYRKLFPYPEGLQDLVLYERGYECMIPICRLDIFFNEDDFSFKFCEINTDGTSGMVEDMELHHALEYNLAFSEYRKHHNLKTFELYDSFVTVFLEIWEDWHGRHSISEKEPVESACRVEKDTAKPYVAIVDFLEGAYFSDFTHFKNAFEKAGYACEITEITKLRYENGYLISPEGHRIDAIYRRAVTTDVYEHRDEIVPFLQAMKDGAVCCIGNFCTEVAHNKALFKIIRDPETFAFLDEDEKAFVLEHFPFTGYLRSDSTGTELSLQDVIDSKDRWIVKPLDLYGAREISVGSDLSDEEWKQKIEMLTDNGYIFQEYCQPYKSKNIILDEDDAEYTDWINMTGMYMYGGKLAGFFSRLAPHKVIAGHYGGRTLATLVED